jgi:hypothetical protein
MHDLAYQFLPGAGLDVVSEGVGVLQGVPALGCGRKLLLAIHQLPYCRRSTLRAFNSDHCKEQRIINMGDFFLTMFNFLNASSSESLINLLLFNDPRIHL